MRLTKSPRQLPGPGLHSDRAHAEPHVRGPGSAVGRGVPAGTHGCARGRGAGYAVSGLGELVVADWRHAGCGGRQDHALSPSDLA